jgi:phosphatidylinositol phospholipase C delta
VFLSFLFLVVKRCSDLLVPIEAIKEIRTGAQTSSYRIQFSVPEEWESRWLTVIYVVDCTYKTLHMVADTRDTFKLWEVAVRKLYAIRGGLATDLGNLDLRQTVWERQYWKAADQEEDHKLDFKNVKALSKRLNVCLKTPQLMQMFQVSVFILYTVDDTVVGSHAGG